MGSVAMTERETPAIHNTLYAQALGNSQFFNPRYNPLPSNMPPPQSWAGIAGTGQAILTQEANREALKRQLQESLAIEEAKRKKAMQIDTRLVKVFIVDPNDSLSVDDRLIYKGDERLTDLTDQELFFELDMKEMLENHNVKRSHTIDKHAKPDDGKKPFLEPARVRDLKMQVVTLAQF
jgi:hypothetical protein